MKKLLLFVIACTLGLFGTVNAQETITIGNEEEAIRTYSVPFDLYNGYGVCQQLYTADEIGKTAGAIESLALKFVGPTDSDMQTPANQDQVVVDFEIYVENTTMTTLSAFQVVETGDLYFSGKQPMESDAWTTFEFSNSFEYDGTNLLITIYCVGDKYEMKTDNNYYPFYIYSTNGVQCLSASPQDKPIAGVSFSGLNENSGKNILQLTFAAGEGGGEEEGGEELASEFSFDFEDGTLTGLKVFQGEGATGNNWQVTADGDTYYAGQANSKGIYSVSWDENSYTQFYPNNYVVTEQAYQITENSVLSWFMRYTYLQYGEFDKYEVVASEDGTNFNMVLWEGDGNGPNSNTLSLAEYAGRALYLGFRHYAESDPGDALVLDNIVLTAGEGGEEPTPEPEGPVTITIGEGTYATTSAPIANQASYSYSYSQQIYLKEEIGKANGLITSIAFHNKLGGSNTRNIVVYANNTEKSSYATDGELTNLVTVSASDIVYEGEFTFGANETWSTIELQTPFVYTGENLVITVNDKTGVAKGYDGYDQFYATATTNQRCLYFGSYTEVEENMANKSYLSNLTVGGWGSSTPGIPDVQLTIAPLAAGVLVSTETIALGEVQLGEYWSEKEDVTASVSVTPIMTTITSITCDNDFFVLPTIDLTASPIEFEVAYNKNAAAGEYTGNLTITYGDGATKVVPMTATAYAPATPDVFELAQEITFTENAYTDTPVFANLHDDYNLPKEEGANAPDAVYAFELTKESVVAVEVTGTNANYAIYKAEDLAGNGPKADNNYVGEIVASDAPVSFFYDFSEENVIENNFTLLDKDGDGYNWRITEGYEMGLIDDKTLKSDSYKSVTLYPDNYIVTKEKYEITANSVLSFKYYTSQFPDKFGIEVSTDGVNFTSVWSEKSSLASNYAEKVISLSDYAGQTVYIAIRHYESNGNEGYYVTIDDFKLESGLPNSFPAGNYYLVAAAEDEFTVNVAIEALETEEPVAPAAPTNVVATADGMNSIVLTWDAVEGATDYYVYKDGQMWANTNGATTYTENSLDAGIEYCFAVQTVAGNLESELSEPVCATTEAEVELPENQILVGEATTSYLSPFVTALGNAWVEMIYKAEEIGKAGKIAEIAYSYNKGSEVTADIDIYFAEVTKSVFASPADVTPVTDLTLVYSGTGVTLCESEWETFVLDTQFEYSGENNLLVVVATSNASGQNYWNSYSEANTVLIKDTMLDSKKPVMLLTLAEEGGETPEPTPTFTHRLESVGTAWGNTAYTFDEENANRVVAIDEDGLITEVTYNEAGQIASAVATVEEVDEEGNPVETVISGVEYEYDENGVWTSFTETVQGWFGGTVTSETVLNYDAEGRLVSLTSEEYARTIAYNEAGLISEVIEGYILVEEEGEEGDEEGDDNGIAPLSETEIEYSSKITFEYDAEGRLVKKDYYFYDAYETMEFYWGESEVYTYDENGNCVKKESYEVTEENELNSFPYSVAEYIYDLTISNEDVYSFEYPHFAFINYVEPSYVNILLKEKSFYSYYDEDAQEVLSHSYEVTAYNYNPAVLTLPEKPMNLTAEVMSATEVELAWAGFPDAESFTLYQGEAVLAEGLVDPYYTVENLEMGVEYCFAVMATNSVGNSEVSETVCVTIELPAAPANLVAKATSETEIALTWDEVPGIYSYNVYQVVETAEETTYELLGEAWWTEYTVTELTAETEYSFVVKAVSNVGESAASNVATATTLAPAAPTVPAAPVVTGSFEGDKVILEWEAVEGAFAYNLYYGGNLLAGPFEDLVVEIQVPEEGTYCFTVTALNEVGESKHSEEVCVTVTAPEDMEAPAAPVLEATLDGNKAILSWEAVEGATYYDVYIGSTPEQAQYLGTATMEDLPISLELPEPGEYCFFVVAYNLVGASEPSNVACVNYGEGVEENEASFNIYPNPVSDRLVIETEANIEAVTIYTVTGVVVYSEVDFNNNTIDVSDFANGVYVMKVRTENGEAVQRFIKK